jgi:hypothetical protein
LQNLTHSNSERKVLFHLSFSKEYHPPEERVNSDSDLVMIFNVCPGFLHGGCPVNVIKNKNTILMSRIKALLEIGKGGFLLMISVKIDKIVLFIFQNSGQGLAKFAHNNFDIPKIKISEIIFGEACYGGATFKAANL